MKNIKNRYEFQWGERHSMISTENWAAGCGAYALGTAKATDLLMLSKNKYLETFISKAMIKEWQKLSEVLLDKKRRRDIFHKSQKIRRNYFNFFNKFRKIHLSKLTNQQLFEQLQGYIEVIRPIPWYFGITAAEGSHALVNKLTKLLSVKNAEYLMSVLITSTTPDIIFEEEYELYKLGQRKNLNKSMLMEHAFKHAWLFFNSYNINSNLEFLKKRLHEPFDPKRKFYEIKKLKKRQEVIFKGLKNPEIKELSLWFQENANERLQLKNCWGGGEFRFLALFQEIAKRLGTPLDQMMASYRFQDYKKALLTNEGLPKKIIQQRIKGFVLWNNHSVLELIEEPNRINHYFKNLISESGTSKVKSFSGASANPGKAKGKVRIVQSIDIDTVLKDLDKFKSGEILVTWMTQPNMVPIVRKASAIITNEGGITSHAAVIAREFNIPCIVGTKIATKVLKDGDLVEVDANSGIIKMIE